MPGPVPYLSRIAPAFLTLALVLAVPVTRAGEGAGLSTAPDFTALGVDGKTYVLKDLLAKGPVLLDFWATWCTPCLHEMPELQKVWQKHRDRGFTLLGVAYDDQKSVNKVKPLVKAKGFVFPIVFDTDHKIGTAYGVRNCPTVFLIGQDGKIMSVRRSYTPGDEARVEEEIVKLLPAATAPAGTGDGR